MRQTYTDPPPINNERKVMLTPSDLEFARRSVRYLLDQHCTASQIIETLTDELDLSAADAHDLLSETTALVAA